MCVLKFIVCMAIIISICCSYGNPTAIDINRISNSIMTGEIDSNINVNGIMASYSGDTGLWQNDTEDVTITVGLKSSTLNPPFTWVEIYIGLPCVMLVVLLCCAVCIWLGRQ